MSPARLQSLFRVAFFCSQSVTDHVYVPQNNRTDRKKLLEICRKREKREQARKEQLAEESRRKQNLTSHTLPGEALLEIRAGPPSRYFRFARVSR